MSVMRFTIPQRDRLPPDALAAAYLAGPDDVPHLGTNVASDDLLLVQTDLDESAALYVPWSLPGRGELMLCTTQLAHRDAPYLLPVELARGTLHRVRNQIGQWCDAGLTVADPLAPQLQQATQQFIDAATSQANVSAATAAAEQSIEASVALIDALVGRYCEQTLDARLRADGKLPTLLGAVVDEATTRSPHEARLAAAVNAAVIPLPWSTVQPTPQGCDWTAIDAQFEWCRRHGLAVCAAPILPWQAADTPDWLAGLPGGFAAVETRTVQFISSVVSRYRDAARFWFLPAPTGLGDGPLREPEHQLHLMVVALEGLRRLDHQTPVVVSFGRPWGEHLATSENHLSPLHFADALTRADLGINGIGLELAATVAHGELPRRDLLQIGQQVDRWSALGLPLAALFDARQHDAHDAVAALVSLMLTKPAVQAVLCGRLSETVDGNRDGAGLTDARGHVASLVDSLTALRDRFLMH